MNDSTNAFDLTSKLASAFSLVRFAAIPASNLPNNDGQNHDCVFVRKDNISINTVSLSLRENAIKGIFPVVVIQNSDKTKESNEGLQTAKTGLILDREIEYNSAIIAILDTPFDAIKL